MNNEYNIRISRKGQASSATFNQEDILNVTTQHEAMHAVLHRLLSFDPHPQANSLKNKGRINMGSYTLPNTYQMHGNIGVHELAAHGFGLMHSGESAQLLAMASTTGALNEQSYGLVNKVITRELMAISESSDAFTISGSKVTVNIDGLVSLINKLSKEQIYKIGERMAKLGIYLAQKD